jgi:outer membrane protein assembly factor BamB
MGCFGQAARGLLPCSDRDPKAWQWRERFSVGAAPQSFSAPIFVGGDRVIVATLGGGVRMLDVRSGAVKWQAEIPVGVGARPLVREPFLYVAGMDARVRKLRLSTGEQLWSASLPVESTGGLSLQEGLLYVTTADDGLWAIDESTGRGLWSYRRPGPTSSVFWSLRGAATPVVSSDGRQVFAGFSDGTVVGLDAHSGETLWERGFGDRTGMFRDADLQPVLSPDGASLFVALVDGDLIALRSSNGATLWSVAVNAASAPWLDEKGEALFVAGGDGSLKKVSVAEARLLWETDGGGRGVLSQPAGLGEVFVATTASRGGVQVFRRDTGELAWEYVDHVSGLAPPAFDGRRLVALSGRNELLVFGVVF